MAQAQTVTGRIVQKYTISGMVHRSVANVRNLQNVGGNYLINSRTTDSNDLIWYDAATGFLEALSYWMPSAVTYTDAELWEKVSNAWILRATHTLAPTDHKAGTAQNAVQTTLVLRDAQFHQLKVIILEGPQTEHVHYSSLASTAPAALQNFAKQFTSTNTVANAPYLWQVSDSAQYINTSPFVGVTITHNRRVARRRGLT